MIKCCNIVCSIEIVLNGTASLNITIPTKTYNNGECFGLCLQQAIPSSGTPLPVNIVMGASTYPLLKPCGNQVMSDQLRTKRTYCIRAGGNPAHFTVTSCNRLCKTAYVVPQIIPTATAPAAEA